MAEIARGQVSSKIARATGIQTGRGIANEIPKKLANEIVPVIVVNEDDGENAFVSSATRTATGTVAVRTTSAVRDTYLTGATLATQFDAVADNPTISMGLTPFGGASTNLIVIPKKSLTAITSTVTIKLDPPIRLAPATTIFISSTFAAGAGAFSGMIQGFERDPDQI